MTLAAVKDPAMGELGYERVDGDFYPTPPEYLDCLAHFVPLNKLVVWEPACGEGHLSKRLNGLALGVISSDLYDRGFGTPNVDFLKKQFAPPNVDAIITNPPYGDEAEQFIRHALQLMKFRRGVVAMFLRNEYDCAKERMDLFGQLSPFAMKIIVTKRPRWIAGSKGSPRHNYAWFVWDWRRPAAVPAFIHHIHPNNALPILKEAA